MTTILAAETQFRAAGTALERRLSEPWNAHAVDTAALDAMAIEQASINVQIGRLVAQMDAEGATSGALDRCTAEIAALLARAEDLRISRAWAAAKRSGDSARWADYLDLD